ncbi:MAG: GatB/YqeY domain-containing protein [Planctomycetota bacterium]
MTIKDRISEDLKIAMKAKDAVKLGVLRMLKARIIEFETSGQAKELTEEVFLGMVKNLIKQKQESIASFTEANRPEKVAEEKADLAVLEAFLPAGIPEAKVREVVAAVVAELKPAGPKDTGKVMGAAMGKLKPLGSVDGSLVQRLVKEAVGS